MHVSAGTSLIYICFTALVVLFGISIFLHKSIFFKNYIALYIFQCGIYICIYIYSQIFYLIDKIVTIKMSVDVVGIKRRENEKIYI